jgi:hypothetical protein
VLKLLDTAIETMQQIADAPNKKTQVNWGDIIGWIAQIAVWVTDARSIIRDIAKWRSDTDEDADVAGGISKLWDSVMNEFTETSDPPVNSEPRDYASAIEQIRACCDSLSLQIKFAELFYDQKLESWHGQIDIDRIVYDPKFSGIRPGETTLDTHAGVQWTKACQEGFSDWLSTTLAPHFESVASSSRGATGNFAVGRPISVGAGPMGPFWKFQSMLVCLDELLRELAWEIQQGALNLELAVDAILKASQDAANALQEHTDYIGNNNPWGD